MSSKLIVALFLAAKYQMAAKNKDAMSFEPTISCLLDRRFSQLSHTALLILIEKITLFKWKCFSTKRLTNFELTWCIMTRLYSQDICSVLSKWQFYFYLSAHSDFGFFPCVGYLHPKSHIKGVKSPFLNFVGYMKSRLLLEGLLNLKKISLFSKTNFVRY